MIGGLYNDAQKNIELTPEYIHLHLQESGISDLVNSKESDEPTIDSHQDKKKVIRPRGNNQIKYVNAVRQNDINFAVGPTGTEKLG